MKAKRAVVITAACFLAVSAVSTAPATSAAAATPDGLAANAAAAVVAAHNPALHACQRRRPVRRAPGDLLREPQVRAL
ncbi:hypothetical protein [Fodinicola feengrottensis]|uniref:hypothetical protein n=1 Tax=Fodinicola feengrottensis TaxID=435914 RepID=UPI0013D1415C|nr:hypothetical protein [Fodinicola feengrottensis]